MVYVGGTENIIFFVLAAAGTMRESEHSTVEGRGGTFAGDNTRLSTSHTGTEFQDVGRHSVGVRVLRCDFSSRSMIASLTPSH